ncbi:hypothetical protein ACRAVF_33920 (plasmid) [Bradyrhizobium oligotrophicum S58]
MTSSQILALIDAAPAFTDAEPLAGDALRRAGLEALDQALATLRAAPSAAALSIAAEAAGSIVGAEAVNETFAKAALEAAALDAGLLRELGSKAVKTTISAGLKAGKKCPREFRQAAFGAEALPPGSAGKGAEQLQSQPPRAADRMSLSAAESSDSETFAPSASLPSPPTPLGAKQARVKPSKTRTMRTSSMMTARMRRPTTPSIPRCFAIARL